MRDLLTGIAAGAFALAVSPLFALSPAAAQDNVVNVYSYRQPDLIQPLLDAFTAETGIDTQVIFLDKGLEERIQAEGANSPADVIFTVDISRLANAKELGITQPVDNATIEANVPEQYRDPRTIGSGSPRGRASSMPSKERVPETAITYEELADPKWKGRLCMRSGQHVYNLGLIASMIAHNGAGRDRGVAAGREGQSRRSASGRDRDQAKLIHAGGCDIGLGNTYYVGLMQTNEKEPEQKEWAESIKVLFPNAEDRGTQVNISGMALAKNAPNRDNAVKLMEFLASDQAQQVYAEANFEYPVKPGVPVSEVTQSFGVLKPDTLPIAEIAEHRKEASEMVDRVGLDAGPSS
jgi:iron(III) transport system substrate-binding protein